MPPIKTHISPILVTTATNRVRSLLEFRYPNVKVLDCELMDKTALFDALAQSECDLLITYRCPHILPLEIIQRPSRGGYNIHPSLLPKYAGLNPWQDIFHNKEKEGGVTIHRLTEHADQGAILLQRSFPITLFDTISTARHKADQLAAQLLNELLIKISAR